MTDWPDMSNFLTRYCESDVDAANRMNAAMKSCIDVRDFHRETRAVRINYMRSHMKAKAKTKPTFDLRYLLSSDDESSLALAIIESGLPWHAARVNAVTYHMYVPQWVEELINLRQEWMPEISTYLREAARVHSEQNPVLDKYK